jgi:NitT/TauT family transport system ATP-binding protein/nitrate/nitrite transport system substrate-binding protein
LGGNTVTLEKTLAARLGVAAPDRAGAWRAALQTRAEPLPLGIVHTHSTHNLLLRYWLASGGLDVERDVRLVVVPPARAVEALSAGRIAGFCAGAPWGEIAARSRVGETVATSDDIWRNAPEKAFALRARWADENPQALQGAIKALVRAAQFCDEPGNASYTGALLSRQKYLDVDSHAILSSLPGGAIASANLSHFWRQAAMFPWLSQAQWFLEQMARWKLIPAAVDRPALAAQVYRPDLYRAAVASLGVSTPLIDAKAEGAHQASWTLDAAPAAIAMAPDNFCDGAVFQPHGVTQAG